MNVEAMAKGLAQTFNELESIPLSHAGRLIAMLESASNKALLLIVKERVKFCWPVARRILQDRGVNV